MSIRRSSRHLLGVALALSTGVASVAQAQTFTFYTNEAAWQAALFSFVHENFDAGAMTAPGLSFSSTNGSVTSAGGNGYFADRVVRGSASTTWNMLTYPAGVNAFGGNWDMTPGGPGQGIEFTIFRVGGPLVVPQQVPETYTGGFWGFITDQRFTSISYTGGTAQPGLAIAETYNLDDLQYGVTATPEPASYALLGTGLVGLVGVVRLRRRTR